MICPKCGNENADGSKFCSNCSAPLQESSVATTTKKPVYKKWWFWAIVAVVVIVVISSIGGNSTPKTAVSDENSTTSNPDDTASSNEQIGNGTLGDYSASIINYTLTQDYEGNPAVVITYNWTNNSDEATSFAVALNSQVFQNDVECDIGVITNNDVYNADNYMKDIKPGATLDVQLAYVLQDSANPITVEVSELISFSDKIITQTFDITE